LPEEYRSLLHRKGEMTGVSEILSGKSHVHTVCSEARCPNIGKCFKSGTATFLVMGSDCTRRCSFCAVGKGEPSPLDMREADEVIEAVGKMKLDYVVITSVTRDDLEDGGAGYLNMLAKRLKDAYAGIKVELLVPDFKKNISNLEKIERENVDVLNHNLETVKRLYKEVRPGADYDFSLSLLAEAKKAGFITKTGIMVGLGEETWELESLFKDASKAGADIITIGQYFMPSKNHYQVRRYYLSSEFDSLKRIAEDAGIGEAVSGVFVRSSYNAHETYKDVKNDEQK